MIKVILDENLPQPLRHMFPSCEIVTVGFMGWSGIQNGDLINIIDGKFDILITGDQNLRYQQNLKDRKVSIIELPFTRLDQLKPLSTLIQKAIETSRPGGYTQIKIP